MNILKLISLASLISLSPFVSHAGFDKYPKKLPTNLDKLLETLNAASETTLANIGAQQNAIENELRTPNVHPIALMHQELRHMLMIANQPQTNEPPTEAEQTLAHLEEMGREMNPNGLLPPSPQEEAALRLNTLIDYIANNWDSIFLVRRGCCDTEILQAPHHMTRRDCVIRLLAFNHNQQGPIFEYLNQIPITELEAQIPSILTNLFIPNNDKNRTLLTFHQSIVLNLDLLHKIIVDKLAQAQAQAQAVEILNGAFTAVQGMDVIKDKVNYIYTQLINLYHEYQYSVNLDSNAYWTHVARALPHIGANNEWQDVENAVIAYLLLKIVKKYHIELTAIDIQGNPLIYRLILVPFIWQNNTVQNARNEIRSRINWNFQHPVTGNTFLHVAVYANNPEAVRFFIAQGVDRNIRNTAGLTPEAMLQAHHYDLLQNNPDEANRIFNMMNRAFNPEPSPSPSPIPVPNGAQNQTMTETNQRRRTITGFTIDIEGGSTTTHYTE